MIESKFAYNYVKRFTPYTLRSCLPTIVYRPVDNCEQACR